jgi:3-oxocholest-4-en-26-oyl-CoA dehydrogenase alpha subunit
MEFEFTPQEEAFRTELRTFFDQHPVEDGAGEEESNRDFDRLLAERGWLTVAWPKEYGGMGANHMEQLIFKEELARSGRTVSYFGANLVGPTLMAHGTEEQRRHHLPRIAGAEVEWCQGFSEPGAGSDLASLQTRAVRDGDDYIVNGQKIWTSGAHHADWILLLVRTDPDAPKHRGISMLLVDMQSPGITIRPLVQMTGVHGFNEVYFDDVRVPASNLVSEENRGWYAATTTLDFERSGIERNLLAERDWDYIYRAMREPGATRIADRASPSWRNTLTELRVEVEVGRWLARRVAYMQGKGLVPNAEASMSKGFNSEVGQRVDEFGVNLLGLHGQASGSGSTVHGAHLAFRYLDSRRLTIGQGTAEIQRNIIATRGLGLPRG